MLRTKLLTPIYRTTTTINLNNSKRCSSTTTNNTIDSSIHLRHEQYTKQPEYPPIEDISFKTRLLKKRISWHDKIKSLRTVEEKLFELNMPRYYGYKCLMLRDQILEYNSLPMIQHSTRTSMCSERELPTAAVGSAPIIDEKATKLSENIKSDIENAIEFELSGYKHTFSGDMTKSEKLHKKTLAIVNQLNRVLLNTLSSGEDVGHLNEIEVDLEPRHEAFWMVGGIQVPTIVNKKRRRLHWLKQLADEPVNRQFQYIGSPLLTLRHKQPLPVFDENEINELSPPTIDQVPQFKYDPRTIGFIHEYRHGTTIPGFWPGSSNQFGFLSYLNRNYLQQRNPAYGREDDQQSLHALAILASYSWLLGQACYQGFSIFHDLTYPLTTQTIITDGQHWSFYLYQLNTTLVHQDAYATNPKFNQCWSTGEMKLFEEIDLKTGRLVGFNDDVLKQIIKFYLTKPKQRDGIEMRPYLGENEQRIADIENVERREFLESRYKHLVSSRPRHRVVPEIFNWEKIYKVDHNTKPLVPKRRFFELGINPYERRLDDHIPVYTPKAIRPGGPKSKIDKWQKQWYPGVQ